MRATAFGRSVTLVATATLICGPAAAGVWLAAPAQAAACDGDVVSRGDLDGDGAADAVVPMPGYADGAGAIDVRYTAHPSRLLTGGMLGANGGEGTGFGSAVAIGDLDDDGCADLVVGANREGNTGGDAPYLGKVHIAFGSPTGIDPATALTLTPTASAGSNFDDFGAALALTRRYEPGAGVVVHDLYVGAPGAVVSGRADAGRVHRYTITPGGTRIVTTPREVTGQDSPDVPGAAEAGDRFGEVLAAADGGGVWVGDPGEDVGSATDAGAVWFLRTSSAGAVLPARSWSQDSPTVVGAAERGDRFGAAVSSRGGLAVAGVPGEDDGSRRDAGMVQLFSFSSASSTPGRAVTQDSAGIPGALEAGDEFGAAVALGLALTCQESIDLAVGSPGEDVGSRADAGAVTLAPITDTCPATTIRQGSGLAGAAETGDRVGGVLAISRGRTDLDEDYAERLLIGVPEEGIGTNGSAGMVQPHTGGFRLNGSLVAALQYSGGYLTSQSYGRELFSVSD